MAQSGPEKSPGAAGPLTAYARRLSRSQDPVDESLDRATAALGGPSMMQSTWDQALLLGMLVAVTGARRVLELGTFTGRSALAMARALPPDGRLLTCDLSRRWTAIARHHWHAAGVAEHVELRIEPAMELLRSLPPDSGFDLVFLDADKGNYHNYYEEIVPRLRPGGLLVADNVLAGGGVLGAVEPGSVAFAMDRFNRRVSADQRVEAVVLTIGDGLTLARKVGIDGHR